MIALKYKFAALFCIAAVLSWTVATAQEVPKRRPMVSSPGPVLTAPPRSTAVMKAGSGSQSSQVIELSMNMAKVITLPRGISKIIIGNETVADIRFDPAQPTKASIISKGVGSTNVIFIDKNGDIIQQMDVIVTFDNAGIKAALAKLLPGEKIDVSVYRDSVFLSGKVSKPAASASASNIVRQFVAADANVVNLLSVMSGQQVILKVRVTEMDRTVSKDLTANTSFISTTRGTRPRISLVGVSPTLTPFATGTLGFGLGTFGPATYSILEENALVKTLAEPTLTAISGETASFLSGGEFPFPSGLTDSGGITFEYREFGIRLNFTPTVLDNGRINLQIATEISAIGAVALTIPSGSETDSLSINQLTQKRTETTVELPSGGTLMISGLLEDNVLDSIRGVPFLKDIPILGALFRSTAFQREETELIITVTVYLVKPMDNVRSVAVPTDGFEAASDIDSYLLGRLHRRYGEGKRPVWAKPLKGPFGYIMK